MTIKKIRISSLVLANLTIKQFLDGDTSVDGVQKTVLTIDEAKEIGLSLICLLKEGDRIVTLERNDTGRFGFPYKEDTEGNLIGVTFSDEETEVILCHAHSTSVD